MKPEPKSNMQKRRTTEVHKEHSSVQASDDDVAIIKYGFVWIKDA